MKAVELKEVVEAIADTYEGEFVVIALDGAGKETTVHFGGRGPILRAVVAMKPVIEATFASVTSFEAGGGTRCDCPRCVALRKATN